MLKKIFVFVIFLSPLFCVAQENSPLSLIEEEAKKIDSLTGMDFFQRVKFIDTARQPITFSSYKGKICYVDFWYIGCAPCAYEIPYWKKRVSLFASDTNIVFIQICLLPKAKGAVDLWKKYIRENDLPGIQLTYDPISLKDVGSLEIEKIMFVSAYPTYSILNKDGSVMGHQVPSPSTKLIIDYMLFNALRGKMPSKSYIEANQELWNMNTKTTSPEFISWVESFYSMPFTDAILANINGEN